MYLESSKKIGRASVEIAVEDWGLVFARAALAAAESVPTWYFGIMFFAVSLWIAWNSSVQSVPPTTRIDFSPPG